MTPSSSKDRASGNAGRFTVGCAVDAVSTAFGGVGLWGDMGFADGAFGVATGAVSLTEGAAGLGLSAVDPDISDYQLASASAC
jgi:hypothetical protein